MKGVLLLLGTVGFSYMLNKLLLRFSKNFGVESRQNQNLVRWASTAKPTTGGISFYLTFLVGSFVLLLVESNMLEESSDFFLPLFLSATLAFLIGFADDAYGTHPNMKLLGQIVCGVILLGFGIQIEFFTKMDPQLVWLDYGLTLFWVVGLMNSLNMLDNMDGVTATIASTIVMGTMVMVISTTGLSPVFMVLITIIGGFVGFLFWNWRPAKVYMGDTGSMFIGLVLAFFGIQYFWNLNAAPDNTSYIRMALIPIMVFIVPIMDTTFVTISRLSRGISPFQGGRDHLTHNLARVGIPEALVPVTLGIVSLISGLLAFFAFKLTGEWQRFYSLLFGLYPFTVFALFGILYIRGMRILKVKEEIAKQKKTQSHEPVKTSIIEAEMIGSASN
ncbi:MAG: MraY family glycosyltransferase [Bacteroidota bacterium]